MINSNRPSNSVDATHRYNASTAHHESVESVRRYIANKKMATGTTWRPAPSASTSSPVPSFAELRRTVERTERKLNTIERGLSALKTSPRNTARDRAQQEQTARARAQADADQLAFNRAFGFAGGGGVRREGTSIIFETHNPYAQSLAKTRDRVERERRMSRASRPPPSGKTADQLAFESAFGSLGKPSTNMTRREGTSLVFDAAAFARARLRAFSKVVTIWAPDSWPTTKKEPEPELLDDDEEDDEEEEGTGTP